MNKKPRFGALSSSADPEKFSLLVKGVGGAIVTLIVAFSPLFGLDISGIDFNELVEQIYQLVLSVSATLSTGAILYGGLRKVWYRFFPKAEV